MLTGLPSLIRTEHGDMGFLRSVILDVTVKKVIANKLHMYHIMTHRLLQLDAHTGFFLLKTAFSLTRLLFLLRSSPCYRHSDDLAPYGECTRSTAESICNVLFDDTCWKQGKQAVRFGGIRLRSASDLALSAYLSSRECDRRLASTILHPPSVFSVEIADDVITTWTSSGLGISDDPVRQFNWVSMLCSAHVAAFMPTLIQHRLDDSCLPLVGNQELG